MPRKFKPNTKVLSPNSSIGIKKEDHTNTVLFKIFRNVYLGNLIKKFIVQRLITNKKTAPFWLTRTMTFQPSQILIRDSLETRKGLNFHKVRLQRNFTPIHMGSAKYFHDSDLEIFSDCSETDLTEKVNSAGKAENCFTIGFSQSHDTNHNVVPVQADE